MAAANDSALIAAIRAAAHPLNGSAGDYDPLLALAGDGRLVLLGEASHGTHDFYRERARITQRLIVEKGFDAVAVEADWPDALLINRYVRGAGSRVHSRAALAGFKRFPHWMWRNIDVLEFIEWLRDHNDALPPAAPKVGFYGLDLYSLHTSIEVVLRYLHKVDPAAAERARFRYGCFEHFGEDTQAYAYAASFGLDASCEQQVLRQLRDLQQHAADYASRGGDAAGDEYFFAEQNARLVKNAEEYYRTMFGGRVDSWNRRDRHMAETLEALESHLGQDGRPPRIVLWEHNSHLGDARATELGAGGELNVGQLVRERHGAQALLVGCTTDHGSVIAASEWDAPAQVKRVRPALDGSYEALFHQTAIPRFQLALRNGGALRAALCEPRLERAIGVIYRPDSERLSHYFHARLAEQFDAVLHFDETEALQPLESSAAAGDEVPETFPTGI